MKPATTIPLATWMLEHLTFGHNHEALSGDLLEEFQAGRSQGWYWRQVLIAIGIGARQTTRHYALPLVFSAVWSTLYPLWMSLATNRLIYVMPDRWRALSWPYSAILDLANGILPAAAFIWVGLLLYLMSSSKRVCKPSPLRLLRSLSTSLSVLLAATLALLYHRKNPVMDMLSVTRGDFYSIFHLFAINIPLSLSLLAALMSLLPVTPRFALENQASRPDS
jgi:hypothetical protein